MICHEPLLKMDEKTLNKATSARTARGEERTQLCGREQRPRLHL